MKTSFVRFASVFSWLGAASVAFSASVKISADSGSRGAYVVITNVAGVQGITCTNNNTANSPGLAARVTTYSVSFPKAGTYDLYVKIYVGPAGASDDSFLYGNGFGTKTLTDADWILANNLSGVGYSTPTSVVGGGGTVGNQVWKWLDLSQFNGGEAPITFVVPADNSILDFQIGGREDGLTIAAFLFGTSGVSYTVADLEAGDVTPEPVRPRDLVSGNLIQFADNGAWSWYMDERAVIDQGGNKLVTGFDVSGKGVGGSPRNGAIDAVVYDLASGARQESVLLQSGVLGCDDHNAPGLLVRPDGKYLAQYTGHNANFLSYFNVYSNGAWAPFYTFDWGTVGATNSGETTSYSNPHFLSAENRTYTFVRCMDNRSPHSLISSDYGDTWAYGGQLVGPDGVVGYNSGYFRYCDNGVDRIDFICTEAHPRDVQTSIYHGYISNGMSFKSDGTVVDTNIFDRIWPVSRNFQPVFTNTTISPPGQTNYRCWNSDVQRYADGTVQCIIHARINQFASGGYPDTVDPDHAFFFCRYDNTNWTSTYLCQAGYKLYPDEADYVGLGAMHPTDPNVIYISTRYDPRAVQPGVFDTNQPYSSTREIWKGVTTNHGASFTWTAITHDSVRDNVRPIVPMWDRSHTALLWFRGTYSTAQIYDEAVVGLIEREEEAIVPMTYVDATTDNTTLTNGSPLVTGPGANQWHAQTDGNDGSVFSSADAVAENAPMLKTHVVLPDSATYDVWINFWAVPASDWRIVGGLAPSQMQMFRQMASKEVEPGDHTTTLVLTNSAGAYLYQAHLGRVSGGGFDVFVDDNATQTGTTTMVGNTARTWYDGVSYAKVTRFGITSVVRDGSGSSATITWNSVPIEKSLRAPTYTLQKKNALSDPEWSSVATGIPSAGISTSFVDNSANGEQAFYRVIRD